jgi:hypothetical protein
MERITLWVEDDTRDKIRVTAHELGVSQNFIIGCILTVFFRELEHDPHIAASIIATANGH